MKDDNVHLTGPGNQPGVKQQRGGKAWDSGNMGQTANFDWLLGPDATCTSIYSYRNAASTDIGKK